MTSLPGAEVANFMSHLDNFLENIVVELLVNVTAALGEVTVGLCGKTAAMKETA